MRLYAFVCAAVQVHVCACLYVMISCYTLKASLEGRYGLSLIGPHEPSSVLLFSTFIQYSLASK